VEEADSMVLIELLEITAMAPRVMANLPSFTGKLQEGLKVRGASPQLQEIQVSA
jgi:hypothetical protein